MLRPLIGEKFAILAANGFAEDDIIQAYDLIQGLGADARIISIEHGVLSSWTSAGEWGKNFAVDNVLGAAMAADYSGLVIPGGERSVSKIGLARGARSFIKGFLQARKPILTFNSGLAPLLSVAALNGRTVTGPLILKRRAVEAGAYWSDSPCTIDDNLITLAILDQNFEAFKPVVTEAITGCFEFHQVA